MVYMHDVSQVHNGSAVQTNIVHVDGSRSVLLSVFKNGTTSTLDIVSGIKHMLQVIKPSLPDELDIKAIGDQSFFVRASVQGVIREGVIAAKALTSLVILLFLGSWRSTLIVTTSIPLSVLGAIGSLYAIGETLNIMTLGGLALAVGILVDEATVTIEGINYHLEQGEDVETAILGSASQIVIPAFVSLLCICIVFIPMFFFERRGALHCSCRWRKAWYLPSDLFLLAVAHAGADHGENISCTCTWSVSAATPTATCRDLCDPLVPLPTRLRRALYAWMRAGYHGLLGLAIEHRRLFVAGFRGFHRRLVLARAVSRPGNFFPQVDGGQILLHVRTPVGTCVLRETAGRFARVEKTIREVIPAAEVGAVAKGHNIGTYLSSINTIYNNTGTIGESDGDIQISLNEGNHAPTADYVGRLRQELPRRFPGTELLVPARRHRQPDPEFWRAGAD